MAKIKKAQLGDTLNIKRTIGDSVALKQKADSVGISTSKAKEALAKRIAAKKKAQNGKDVFKKNKPLTDSLSKKNMQVLDTTYKAKPADKAKDGKWIQKAVNPAHKGYCTPMTKATCTPKRKALAMTFKKMAKSRKGK